MRKREPLALTASGSLAIIGVYTPYGWGAVEEGQMTKGQKAVMARLPRELYDAFMMHIERHNSRDGNPHWSISDAVVAAVIEMVHHGRRSRGHSGPRPTSTTPDAGERRIMEGG